MIEQKVEKRRRESSYTDYLDDPIKWMEVVKSNVAEDEDLLIAAEQARRSMRNKRRGSFINSSNKKQPLLEEIDEE